MSILKIIDNAIKSFELDRTRALQELSNRAIQAFSVKTFSQVSYPFSIESVSELWRYHNVMQEGRFEFWMKNLGAIRSEEEHLIRNASFVINEFRQYLDPENLRSLGSGKDGLASSLFAFRILKEFLEDFKGGQPILEMGPGNGYLALLLALDGKKVEVLELSQAFYAYQVGLFSTLNHVIAKGLLKVEGVSEVCLPIHRSIWDLARQDVDLPAYKVVTANHMLGEMRVASLRAIIQKLSRVGEDSPLFIADHLGGGTTDDNREVFEAFNAFGYTSFKTDRNIFLWSKHKDEGTIRRLESGVSAVFSPIKNPLSPHAANRVFLSYAIDPDNDSSPDERFGKRIGITY